jgi:hypothetical protein
MPPANKTVAAQAAAVSIVENSVMKIAVVT